MRNLLIIALILIGIGANGQQAKRYAIKSGYIKLELTGNTTGTKEIWWDNYGNKTSELEKSTSVTKLFGMKSEEKKHMLTILVNDRYWVRDYIEGTGTTGTVPGYQDAQEFANLMSEKEQEEFANSVLEGMGGQRLGQEKVGNYNCEVFTVMGAKSWIYKGIALKTEAKIMGIEANEKYIDFKPGTSVSASKFSAPKDVKYDNLNAMSQGMFGAMEMNMGDDDEEEDEAMVPVNYSFEKFKSVINSFSHPGYKCLGTNSMEGIHAANFMKGLGALMVVATSRQNAEPGEHDSFEAFTSSGHKCFYGETDDDGTALVVEYPKYDMYITIVGVPDLSKNELLEIEKKMQF
ncbi:hypothetical protein J1N10_06430 [Carboxylicivirga sp. A043]|uniref:hypothetical protein n=1 Tax=Carboxylicivirga litoralis TaxID=2816963 RepID=UPI0021CB0AF1|nr:hypothetical protein [Carboxylicivirga sp. A043]MCU4155606.1 hypothetical protein [Carboxylicivirga sp. A043]